MLCIALASPVFGFASRSTHGVIVRKGSKGQAATKCPKGEHVAFGGVVAQFQPPVGAGALVFPTGMRRTQNNEWTVYGHSGTPFGGSRLTAVAYCARGSVPRVASQTVRLPGYGFATAFATCPPGTTVVGGGYNSGASSKHLELLVRLQRSPSLGQQWLVTMVNLRPAATTLTAIAYCSSGIAPTMYATTVTLAGGKGATARVSCPSGKSLIFGGVLANSPTVGNKGADVSPFSWTAANTKQWVVTGYNAGNLTGALSALAYCR